MNIYKPLLVIEERFSFTERMLGARGIPVSGAWISVFRNVVSRILMSRRRKMAESFIFFSIKCFAESRRKQKFAAEIFQGEVKSLDRRL